MLGNTKSVITLSPFRCGSSIVVGHVLSCMNFPYFHIETRRDFSCSYMLCNGASIHKYKAYWYMNFSLINGCITGKNNIHVYSFF